MTIQRALALVGIAGLALTSLVACGSDDTASSDPSIGAPPESVEDTIDNAPPPDPTAPQETDPPPTNEVTEPTDVAPGPGKLQLGLVDCVQFAMVAPVDAVAARSLAPGDVEVLVDEAAMATFTQLSKTCDDMAVDGASQAAGHFDTQWITIAGPAEQRKYPDLSDHFVLPTDYLYPISFASDNDAVQAAPACSTAAAIVGAEATSAAGSATDPAGDAVVLLADSITADNVELIQRNLDREGHSSVRYAALGARRIEVSHDFFGWRNSGLDEIRALLEDGVDPDLWIVELGTNDLPSIAACACDDPVEFAGRLIDLVLDSIGPGNRVAWVTVLNRDDPASTQAFNDALRDRARTNPTLQLLDWHTIAVDNPHWFVDHVHPTRLGALMLTRLYHRVLEPHDITTAQYLPAPPRC